MEEKSLQPDKGDAAVLSRRHTVGSSPGEAAANVPSATASGVSTPDVAAASTLTAAAAYGSASAPALPQAHSASATEGSNTQGALSGTTAPSAIQPLTVTAPDAILEERAAVGHTPRKKVAFETSAALNEGSASAGENKGASAANHREAETSAMFLATPVATMGVAREVTGMGEDVARFAAINIPSPIVRPPTKTVAELEDVSQRQTGPTSDAVSWGGEKYLGVDPFELRGSPEASFLIFALYSTFFFVAGFSLAEASLQLSAPIGSMVKQRCAGTPEGGICLFAQGLRSVSAGGVAVGFVFGGSFADYCGRKTLLWISDVFLLVGLSLPLATVDFSLFWASQMLFGVGLGGGLVAVSVFLVECAPASARGLCLGIGKLVALIGHLAAVSLTSTAPNFGSLCALGMPALIVTFHSLALLSMAPESPRWLVRQKRPVKAIEALLCFGDQEGHAAEAVLQQEQALGFSQALQPAAASTPQPGSCLPKTYRTLFGVQRSKFFVALTSACVAACVGAGFLDIYPAFSITDEEWFWASRGIIETLGVVLSTTLVDCWGREPLLRIGTIGVALGFSAATVACFWHMYLSTMVGPANAAPLGGAGEADFGNPAQAVVPVGILFARFMQNFSWSTLLPVVVAEVLPTSVRATGTGLALGLLMVLEMVVHLTAPCVSSEHAVAVTLLAYTASSYIAVALLALGLREGKGYRLEELAPESADGNTPWVSDASRQMQELQGRQILQGQEMSSPESSYSQTNFALNSTTVDAPSSEPQNAAEQQLEREVLGVC